jgi:hypothetical protein
MNAPIEVGLQINLGTPKCLHQTEPDWRLLRVRAQRPGVSSATNKYDEFPLPHGLTRRGLHRVWQEYHILDRELRRSLHPREPPHVRFGSFDVVVDDTPAESIQRRRGLGGFPNDASRKCDRARAICAHYNDRRKHGSHHTA